jgi:hypothetical protein
MLMEMAMPALDALRRRTHQHAQSENLDLQIDSHSLLFHSLAGNASTSTSGQARYH